MILSYSVKCAQINGSVYKCGALVITDSDLMPTFAKIIDIIFPHPDCTPMFVCVKYTTNCFNYHYHSYEVTPLEEHFIIHQSDLVDHHIVHQYEIDFHTVFVPLKYHVLECL